LGLIKTQIFFSRGLDSPNQLEFVRLIVVLAHGKWTDFPYSFPWSLTENQRGQQISFVRAGLAPAIHALFVTIVKGRRGCPAQGRA
jgi:hypothetical protein